MDTNLDDFAIPPMPAHAGQKTTVRRYKTRLEKARDSAFRIRHFFRTFPERHPISHELGFWVLIALTIAVYSLLFVGLNPTHDPV